MTDPLLFDSKTPRFGFPLLFAGQAQKEAFVNEALAIADSLLHFAVEGTLSAPPADPQDGFSWIVSASPAGAWAGQAGAIAMRQAGNWLFTKPIEGMRAYDRSTGQDMRFFNSWQAPVAVMEPSGGQTVDAGARAAIHAIVVALQTARIIPAT